MLSLPGKSSVEPCCLKGNTRNSFVKLIKRVLCFNSSHLEKASSFWDAKLNSTDIREQGLALLILVMCLYNISRLFTITSLWRRTKAWLPSWLVGSNVDKRIDSLTADLRMEMRELSEQIIEFQKWSKMKLDEPAPQKTKTITCKQCREKGEHLKVPVILKTSTFMPQYIDNEISECNWLQYLHKYVYNPNPRILDTGELENIKRAYSNWFQY